MEIEDMLEMVDIVDLVSNYVDLTEKSGEYWGLSPFQDEKTPSFSVRRETGKFFDFSSGVGGNAITFLKYYFHISSYEAVLKLKEILGVNDVAAFKCARIDASRVCKRFKPVAETKKPATGNSFSETYMEHYEDRPDKYQVWRDEGISDEALKYFGVKYDSFSNCIVYPVKNERGQIVNIGGRTLEPNFKAKGIRKYTYFNKWGGQMNIVYGLYENMDDIIAKREIILFEGMKSVLIARGYGFKNCGAILTSHLNPGQMKLLAGLSVKYSLRIVFALDKEVDVFQDRNIQSLKRYVNVESFWDKDNLLDKKDSPVDKGQAVFERLYHNKIKVR